MYKGLDTKTRMRSIPKGWKDYSNWGTVVPGTKFLPFKTPLKESVHVPYEMKHTPQTIMESFPDVKLIINLTETGNGRYYDYEDFFIKGVSIVSIQVRGGGKIPQPFLLRDFVNAVRTFRDTTGRLNPDALIGVHCTHGLNRTGYFICKYMTDYMGLNPHIVLESFESARGYKIDRENYVCSILRS